MIDLNSAWYKMQEEKYCQSPKDYLCPYKQGPCSLVKDLESVLERERKKKKVFCINCKHVFSVLKWNGFQWKGDDYYCGHPDAAVKEDTWLQPGEERGRKSAEELNKNNDCPLYENEPLEDVVEEKIPLPAGIIIPVKKKSFWQKIKDFPKMYFPSLDEL